MRVIPRYEITYRSVIQRYYCRTPFKNSDCFSLVLCSFSGITSSDLTGVCEVGVGGNWKKLEHRESIRSLSLLSLVPLQEDVNQISRRGKSLSLCAHMYSNVFPCLHPIEEQLKFQIFRVTTCRLSPRLPWVIMGLLWGRTWAEVK